MNEYAFSLADIQLVARSSGALWWPGERVLAVSDLHLGKSDRLARGGGPFLPPYETPETLARLDAEIAALAPASVICLGDSFDDPVAVRTLDEAALLWLARMQAGRRWIWITGNHDPGTSGPGGTQLTALVQGPLTFRHIAQPGARAEVSGHYHPKARLAGQSRPCFLIDRARVILPAFGAYTGGLSVRSRTLGELMQPDALAVLTTGKAAHPLPMRA